MTITLGTIYIYIHWKHWKLKFIFEYWFYHYFAMWKWFFPLFQLSKNTEKIFFLSFIKVVIHLHTNVQITHLLLTFGNWLPYLSNHLNRRINFFSPESLYLKSISTQLWVVLLLLFFSIIHFLSFNLGTKTYCSSITQFDHLSGF